MPRQILQLARYALALEVVRRAADHPAIGKQLDRHVVGVGDLADADAHVVAVAHQVDHAVGEVERQLQIGEARLEGRRMRADMPTTECRWCRDHQMAAHRGAILGDAGVGLVEILEQPARPLQVLLAQVGQRQATGGAVHQLDAQVALQGIETAAHHHRRHAFLQCSGGEAAGFGDQHEAVYGCVTIHSILLISTELKSRPIPPSVPALHAWATYKNYRTRKQPRSCELETCKAKAGEEAEFAGANEHSEPGFNAAGPTRSRS